MGKGAEKRVTVTFIFTDLSVVTSKKTLITVPSLETGTALLHEKNRNFLF